MDSICDSMADIFIDNLLKNINCKFFIHKQYDLDEDSYADRYVFITCEDGRMSCSADQTYISDEKARCVYKYNGRVFEGKQTEKQCELSAKTMVTYRTLGIAERLPFHEMWSSAPEKSRISLSL